MTFMGTLESLLFSFEIKKYPDGLLSRLKCMTYVSVKEFSDESLSLWFPA